MGLLELFTKIGIVIAKGAPVILALVGFTTATLTVYSSAVATCNTFTFVSTWIQTFSDTVSSAMTEVDVGGGPGGAPSYLLPTLLRTLAVDNLLSNVSTLFVSGLAFLVAYAGILATVVGSGVGLWAYKKSKLFANIVSGSSVSD